MTVRPRDSTRGSASSASVAATAPREVFPDFREWCAISQDTAEALRNTTDPVALAEFDFPELTAQSIRLRGSDRTWVPRARVARAVRAGIFARGRLEGQVFSSKSESPGIPYRNTIYVVLRTGIAQNPFWTSSYRTYISHTKLPSGEFRPEAISHAFATQAEADCFLAGARKQWPMEV